jgi:hypothetical protein
MLVTAQSGIAAVLVSRMPRFILVQLRAVMGSAGTTVTPALKDEAVLQKYLQGKTYMCRM